MPHMAYSYTHPVRTHCARVLCPQRGFAWPCHTAQGDESLRKHKRPRPCIPTQHKLELIKSLRMVDEVVVGADLEAPHGLDFQVGDSCSLLVCFWQVWVAWAWASMSGREGVGAPHAWLSEHRPFI